MQLTLIVPELIWPEPGDRDTQDAIDCPALETLLARSRRTRCAPQSLEATLSDLFGQPPAAPYAALRLLGEPAAAAATDVGQGYWLCSDPVHLRFHQEGLILADSTRLGISLDEAQTLAGELNRQLAELGCFHVAAAERWYLQLADSTLAAALDSPPLSAAAGRRIASPLPGAARRLRALHNEAQMLLHAHPLNARREEAGRLPINSLWLWGGGALPARRACDFDEVWSDHPLARGLARAAGVPTQQPPADAATLLAHAAPASRPLIVLDELLAAVVYENGEAYCSALAGLEARWFAPLRAALASGKISALRIVATTAYAALTWDCTRRAQWALWRRAQPLGALASELAQHD